MKIALLLGMCLLASTGVFAYSGSFSILPSFVGGPATSTVTQFDLDTQSGTSQVIITDLYYVQSVVITTNSPQSGPLLVTEKPDSTPYAFSFTVPQKINDDLISAEIYFWGPDVALLTITHEHGQEDPQYLEAQRAQPEQTDSNGNILWTVTTTSFSDFSVGPLPQPGRTHLPVAQLLVLSLACISCIALFWKNHLPWFR